MILTCNSCGKKFVVPDSAITASGRMVQCGSCGNKWKQFPVDEIIKPKSSPRTKKVVSKHQPVQPKIQKTEKSKKNCSKKNQRNQFILARIFGKKTWYQTQRSTA